MTLSLGVDIMADCPVGEVAELAAYAEQLGFSRCAVYDEGLVTRDVYVILAAIAARTQTVLIGPGITNPYVRHPGATATAIASLDELAPGRVFLGLGAGGGLTLAPLAIDRLRPLTAVREMIEALRQLFAGEQVDLDGHSFSFSGARLDYGRRDIEIWLAGRGPKMMELGGRVADGFTLSYTHKRLLGTHVASLRRAAGDRPFRIIYSTAIACTEPALAEARAALTFRLVDSPSEVKDMIGMTDTDTAAIRAALAHGGPAEAAEWVREDWVSQFVITGSPDEAAAELKTLMAGHGIDEFLLPVDAGHGAAGLMELTASISQG